MVGFMFHSSIPFNFPFYYVPILPFAHIYSVYRDVFGLPKNKSGNK